MTNLHPEVYVIPSSTHPVVLWRPLLLLSRDSGQADLRPEANFQLAIPSSTPTLGSKSWLKYGFTTIWDNFAERLFIYKFSLTTIPASVIIFPDGVDV